jgi:hypothetical protein
LQTKSKLVGYIVTGSDPNTDVLLGFGALRIAQQKEREGAGIPGGCSSLAKGRQSPPPGKEDQGMRESRREGGKNRRNRDEPEAVRRRAVNEPSSSEPATSSWSLIASRAELDLSLRSRPTAKFELVRDQLAKV